RSHAAGVGDPLDEEEVRAALAARANSLATGHSGVRASMLDLLASMMNRGVHPVVPQKGSLGASGDLAPLAHIGLVLIGEGEAVFRGRRMSGAEAMKRARLRPMRLETKEGLAFVNGTSVMAGLGSLAVSDSWNLLRSAEIAAAMSIDALKGSDVPFLDDALAVRRDTAARDSGRNLLRLLARSEIRKSHIDCKKVQDAYSLRCAPQVFGAVRGVIDHVEHVVEDELNSCTDNPVVLTGSSSLLSAGNFHGQRLAMALDYLALAMCVLANFAERRVARLVDAHVSDLPPFLTKDSGLSSGMMITQYSAAAVASELKVLAHPASADSIPTSAGQEDFVPMGMGAALKARAAVRSATTGVAIELLCAAQAIEFHRPLRSGAGVEVALKTVRSKVRRLREDRSLSKDIATIEALIAAGDIVNGAAPACGGLR
ncbi:MAG TPA: histidine ammonia-lyase, partial [Thermoplasmata archaeon]|nr:histidine ammonia-lyase [Thermoplasmata archaeon]